MTIELDKDSYIVGMWFSECPDKGDNWLSCIIKDPKNPKRYKAWSRFRYAKDNKIWDSDDTKSWTTFISQEGLSDEDMISFMEQIVNMKQAYSYKDRIIVKGNLNKLMELSKDKDWMHMKEEMV